MVKPVSTKNTKISWVWRQAPVIPATQEAEAGESLELGRQRLQRLGELKLRGTTPCRLALQRRVRSAVRGTASSGAVTGKKEPRLNRIERQSASSPGRGGSQRDPAIDLSNFRRDRHPRRSKCSYSLPPPVPLPRLCKAADAPTVGPKTLHPASISNPSTLKGDKGAEELLGASGQESPTARDQNVAIRARSRPEGCGPSTPTSRLEQHSPVRSSQGGWTQGASSSRVAAALGAGALYATSRTPTSLGRCSLRQLGREPGRRALLSCRGGTAGSPPKPGGNFRPRSPPAREDPHPPSVCSQPAAATAAAKPNTTAAA
ncbi:hypothetical protein AAY473_018055 [Plecturocebus cupreus]